MKNSGRGSFFIRNSSFELRNSLILAANLALGVLPLLILGASWAAGTPDDRHHRRTFLFVYGLWSITLAMWNWMRSAPIAWIVLWVTLGVSALMAWRLTARPAPPR
jgi:hypothetical protein